MSAILNSYPRMQDLVLFQISIRLIIFFKISCYQKIKIAFSRDWFSSQLWFHRLGGDETSCKFHGYTSSVESPLKKVRRRGATGPCASNTLPRWWWEMRHADRVCPQPTALYWSCVLVTPVWMDVPFKCMQRSESPSYLQSRWLIGTQSADDITFCWK